MVKQFSPAKWFSLLVCIALTALSSACNGSSDTPAPVLSPQPSAENAPTASPVPPTPTPPPLAATVDGAWILLEDLDAETLRVQDAQAADTLVVAPQNQRQTALDYLIDETLLAAAAEDVGQSLDDAALQARLDALTTEMGGADALRGWLDRNHYTDESFRRALRRSTLAAWQRDQIVAAVPQTAEQVHARQILLRDLPVAQNLHAQLVGGADFATLALQYDPVTGGELGWFPRGFLTQPTVEEAAFALQPDQFSDVIESPIGYHLVYVVERDPQHPLSPEALRLVQNQALADWLAQHRAQSQITNISP